MKTNKQTNKHKKQRANHGKGPTRHFVNPITTSKINWSCSLMWRLRGALRLRRTPARLALQIAPPPDGGSIHLYAGASCAPARTCRLKCCLQPQHNAWLCRAAAKWPLLDASYRWPRHPSLLLAPSILSPPLATRLTPPLNPIPAPAAVRPLGGTSSGTGRLIGWAAKGRGSGGGRGVGE